MEEAEGSNPSSSTRHMRASFNGKIGRFQRSDEGSIPSARTKFSQERFVDGFHGSSVDGYSWLDWRSRTRYVLLATGFR